MRAFIAIAFILVATPSFAANKVLILNDADQSALLQLLDQAVRGQGLAAADPALRIYNLLKQAPIQVEEAPKGTNDAH